MKNIHSLREILLDKVVFRPRNLTVEELDRLMIGTLVVTTNKLEL